MGLASFAQPDPTPAAPAEDRNPLRELDGLIGGGTTAMRLVDGDPDELAALARHLERRAATIGRRCLLCDGRIHDEPWREVAELLGINPVADALQVGRALAPALGSALLIVHEAQPTHWGAAVAEEVGRLLTTGVTQATVVVLTRRRSGVAKCIELPARFEDADVECFWDALVAASRRQAQQVAGLASLERWWRRGGAAGGRARGALLSPTARRLHARLALLRRGCSETRLLELGTLAGRDELIHGGWIQLTAGRATIIEPTARPDVREASQVAEVLSSGSTDPWAAMRAAELATLADEHSRASELALQAVAGAPDAAARADFWRRIEDRLAGQDDAERLGHLAELALACGDVDQALTMARRAIGSATTGTFQPEQQFRVALTLGQATRARGDRAATDVALSDAMGAATDGGQRAQVALEWAELALATGDPTEAREQAEAAHAEAPDRNTRLGARNVLGKVLLAEARWSEAERHFASDENEAACADRDSDVLRARLNRAIAVLSSGRRGEARALFESVLAEGRRIGERRATAFALANLSAFATLAHDYVEALSMIERAIDEMRALGDRQRLARLIMNLAELRLRLGMVDEADQALTFARQACGPAPSGAIASLFAFVTARSRLSRGNGLQAAADVEDAIAAASRSSNGAKLGECHRLAVRIALEDGDVPRAERHLDEASSTSRGTESQADLAVVAAAVARAAGRPYDELSARALRLAEAAEDIELGRQAHTLCCHAGRDQGDDKRSQEHLTAAVRLRNQVTCTLPAALAERFLSRRDLVELSELEQTRQVAVEQAPARRRRKGKVARPRLVGDTPAIRSLRVAIAKVGRSNAPVLIGGESGTGKELVADAIHRASSRADGPLVKVNCAALVETLLLSELFGHEKGAFTGAQSRKRGRFEQAHGGTIFLDEIGDISPATQVALLRVLQEHRFERVGGTSSVEVDVRVMCATHRDLAAMVAEGTFREDLYYRLCGVPLQVPALRERLADLPSLSAALLDRIGQEQTRPAKTLSDEAMTALGRHQWPGNVRELDNALRAADLFADGEVITLRDLTDNVASLSSLARPASIPPASETRTPPCSPPDEAVYRQVRGGTSLPEMKRAMERACIERALEEADDNITRAAELLGMKRPRLSQLVNQYAREKKVEVAR